MFQKKCTELLIKMVCVRNYYFHVWRQQGLVQIIMENERIVCLETLESQEKVTVLTIASGF